MSEQLGQAKEAGNKAFARGNLEEALQMYSQCSELVNGKEGAACKVLSNRYAVPTLHEKSFKKLIEPATKCRPIKVSVVTQVPNKCT